MTSRLVRPSLRLISGNVLIVLALAAVQFRIVSLNVGGNGLVSVVLAMLAGALVVRRSKWTGASIIWGVGGTEALAGVGRQIANQARNRGVSSQTVSTSASMTFSQGVFRF
jgi:hypothetical protein